nr:MAG TPA: phenylalanyl-tRNA synthetase subunit alpha [Caudoviricetes sp.]
MARLTEIRKAVLQELVRTDGTHSQRIARHLGCAQTSVASALQWLRRTGYVEVIGYWHATPAGRAALAKELQDHG